MKKQRYYFSTQHLNLILLSFIPSLLIILGFLIDSPKEIFKGLYDLIIAPDILLTDYLAVGGIGATFLNAGILGLLCIFIVYFLEISLTGPLIAAILTVIGFSFIGKNIGNVWPILVGGLLYCRHKKIEFKTILTPILFATTLAPAVSEIAFGLNLSYYLSIPLGIGTGILIGFIIIPVSLHIAHFHSGYNLYNMGFAGGIIGTLITSLIQGFGFSIRTQSTLSTEYSIFMKYLLIFISAFYLIVGYIMNNRSFKGYSNVLKTSGHSLGDFIQRFGFGLAYINIGIMGFISILYVLLTNGVFNGPIVAGIVTVMAFAPFGKHPRNSVPIFIGVYLAAIIKIFNASSTTVIMAALFGTALAPIAGSYGFIAGIIAGFLHVSVVANVLKVHNGLNLYNNGFSCGIVAGIMVPILEAFSRKGKKERD
ncbi:DUF1576 domain-containing protein [Tissierella sp. MB52-C2]|uniref:DUF1576 domain-containing protein n=1 Tax=Tissierella sp. MB52-C2 TaxID=3070999 RepID=UPI00280B447D|nr:DUF1576 domain-containing protein [Tissierella sp. MB52-C2]WMM25297.1 DUF1576 domain-containing protein [Tissierella sp. MB52-C2]